jgi:hypothetical protein
MQRHLSYTGMALLSLMFLAGCAAGPNELMGTAGPGGSAAGFWLGLWHGFISLFTFLLSLFREEVSVYEVHNNGAWYDLGFIIGVTSFFGGGGGKASRRSKRDPLGSS